MREWKPFEKEFYAYQSRCEVMEEVLESAERLLVNGKIHEALIEIRKITDSVRARREKERQ